MSFYLFVAVVVFCLYAFSLSLCWCLQVNEKMEPTDRIDSLAFSIMKELGSSATDYIEAGMKAANEECVSQAVKVQASLK